MLCVQLLNGKVCVKELYRIVCNSVWNRSVYVCVQAWCKNVLCVEVLYVQVLWISGGRACHVAITGMPAP